MSNIGIILKKYLFLVIIFIVLYLFICLFLKNKLSKKNSYVIKGLVLGLSKLEIFALTLMVVNCAYLLFLLIMKCNLSKTAIIVSSILIIISVIMSKKLKGILDIIINTGNLLVIYLNTYVISLKNILDRPLYIAVQSAVNVFGILFIVYTLLIFIKNLVFKEIK